MATHVSRQEQQPLFAGFQRSFTQAGYYGSPQPAGSRTPLTIQIGGSVRGRRQLLGHAL